MRTKIDWPDVGREDSGMMGFPAEWTDYTASRYRGWIKPRVEHAIVNLEKEIDELKAKNKALEIELKAAKPKVKYNQGSGVWELVQAQCGWKPPMDKAEEVK